MEKDNLAAQKIKRNLSNPVHVRTGGQVCPQPVKYREHHSNEGYGKVLTCKSCPCCPVAVDHTQSSALDRTSMQGPSCPGSALCGVLGTSRGVTVGKETEIGGDASKWPTTSYTVERATVKKLSKSAKEACYARMID